MEELEEFGMEDIKLLDDGELAPEEMEQVSGGVIITGSVIACYAVSAGLVAFFASYGNQRCPRNAKKKKSKKK